MLRTKAGSGSCPSLSLGFSPPLCSTRISPFSAKILTPHSGPCNRLCGAVLALVNTLELGTAVRVEPAVLLSNPVFGDHTVEHLVEEAGREPPHLLLEAAAGQAVGRAAHMLDDLPLDPHQGVNVGDAAGGGAPGMPRTEARERVDGVGQVMQEGIP